MGDRGRGGIRTSRSSAGRNGSRNQQRSQRQKVSTTNTSTQPIDHRGKHRCHCKSTVPVARKIFPTAKKYLFSKICTAPFPCNSCKQTLFTEQKTPFAVKAICSATVSTLTTCHHVVYTRSTNVSASWARSPLLMHKGLSLRSNPIRRPAIQARPHFQQQNFSI